LPTCVVQVREETEIYPDLHPRRPVLSVDLLTIASSRSPRLAVLRA
jgi:hypothetical protein